MAWSRGTSERSTTLPADWHTVRRPYVMTRDQGVCYLCGQPGADRVDHKTPHSQGGTDDYDNLGAVHDTNPPHCHRAKTGREAAEARAKQAAARYRPRPPHPGVLP